eukprot:TRINITY_DN1949_c0_g1_i1.p1 TRINITY_DN1949_c0_g1~~TRINITY_DN1949_c0_g1_i1.p1  ORF type:complete len:183 (+),score=44.75 TRINITY_DN1949_c0_g1_i1:105-653(+)
MGNIIQKPRTMKTVVLCLAALFIAAHAQQLAHKQVEVPEGRYWMNSNEMLASGNKLVSSDGKSELTLDDQCNLHILHNGEIKTYLERSSTQVIGPCFLKINKKGTIILVSSNFKVSVIARARDQKATYYQLALTDRGYIKLYAVNKSWELGVKPKPMKVYIDEDQYMEMPDADDFSRKVEGL